MMVTLISMISFHQRLLRGQKAIKGYCYDNVHFCDCQTVYYLSHDHPLQLQVGVLLIVGSCYTKGCCCLCHGNRHLQKKATIKALLFICCYREVMNAISVMFNGVNDLF